MLDLILLIMSLICFLLGAANVPPSPRVNLIALGLAFWVLTLLISSSGSHAFAR